MPGITADGKMPNDGVQPVQPDAVSAGPTEQSKQPGSVEAMELPRRPESVKVSEAVSEDTGVILEQGDPVIQAPKMHGLQRNPQTIPDVATANPSATKNSLDANSDIGQQLSSVSKYMDATVREEMPAEQQDDLERSQSAKSRAASFHATKDSVEADGMPIISAGTSNTGDNDTSRMFMDADNSDKFTGSEKDGPIEPSDPKFEDFAVNFAKEGQMDKTSRVSLSSNESQPEDRAFQTEVVQQIVEKTAADFKSGRSEIRIDLKPENLGHLRLHVLTDQQQVSVKILAENPHVKEMIENQVSLIKIELQNQGININNVKVDLLMSGGSDFAYSQNEGSAFKQARHESTYGSGKSHIGNNVLQEPEASDQTGTRGGTLVNYFA